MLGTRRIKQRVLRVYKISTLRTCLSSTSDIAAKAKRIPRIPRVPDRSTNRSLGLVSTLVHVVLLFFLGTQHEYLAKQASLVGYRRAPGWNPGETSAKTGLETLRPFRKTQNPHGKAVSHLIEPHINLTNAHQALSPETLVGNNRNATEVYVHKRRYVYVYMYIN